MWSSNSALLTFLSNTRCGAKSRPRYGLSETVLCAIYSSPYPSLLRNSHPRGSKLGVARFSGVDIVALFSFFGRAPQRWTISNPWGETDHIPPNNNILRRGGRVVECA
jgi:hypothetical protein